MKIVAVFLAIIVVVAVIFGFDFSVYEVEDLSVYPELPFSEVVTGLTESTYSGLQHIFPFLQNASDEMLSVFNSVSEDIPPFLTEEQEFYYKSLLLVKDEMNWFDRLKFTMASIRKLPLSVFEDLYAKYYNRSGVSGDY